MKRMDVSSMRRIAFAAASLLVAAPSGVMATPALPATVTGYVAEAFAHNLALQTRTLDLEQARARLAEARSALQPRLDLIARYSRAGGGRTIDFPTGDLLNGVYRTLNDYLRSQGQAAAFPQLNNLSVGLVREREQETKLRLTQPLYQPEITQGVRASRAAAAARESQLAAYRRELRFSVLAAYYGYLQTEGAVEIYDSAAELTAEALRVNQILAAADKLTEDRVLRAEAEALTVAQQRAEAVRDRNSARAYFNFLLNRPLTAVVDRAPEHELSALAQAWLEELPPTPASSEHREELSALRSGIAASEATEAAVRARLHPTLALAVDGGIQGGDYRVNGNSTFVQGSLVARVNIWDGRENRSQLEQAQAERRKSELQLEETRQQFALQLQQADDELGAAVAAHRAALRRADATTRAFDLVKAREREGLASQLVFLDARSELTRSVLNREITRQRLLIAAAALDRAAALTPLP